jgi:CheY-like chemotaxis protein
MVVEDNPINAAVLGHLLERRGGLVGFADNGVRAIELLDQEAWDLILMDRHMPVMDGLEATRAIRRLGSPHAQLPIIAVTAGVFEEERAALEEAGIDLIVSKPVDPAALSRAVGRLVDPDRRREREMSERLARAAVR